MSLSKLVNYSRDIFEFLHDGVAIIDKDGTIIYVNDANYRITGLEKKDLLGKNVRKMIPYSHVPLVLESGRQMIGVETEVNSKRVVSNIVPIVIDGVKEGAISIFRDISEVLYLSKKLDEANSKIESLFKRLSSMEKLDTDIVIGNSKVMANVFRLAQKSALVNTTVLIQGESGTGKEIISRFIHKNSDRRNQPFIALNCAAIPENLLESELFGYEEGAFTGAKRGGRPGVFELSDTGTLFLDEIGDMSFQLQSKLLRVLETKEVLRIGGSKYRKVDLRIISATNKNLYEMIQKQTFRDDLYYRLKVIHIQLPPLRERREDIQLYIQKSVGKVCNKIRKTEPEISSRALKCLLEYDYPGNIRELENIMEMALVLDDDGVLDIDDLPSNLVKRRGIIEKRSPKEFSFTLDRFPSMEEAEEYIFKSAVEKYKSKTALAKVLKVSRSTLYRKLKQYQLLDEIPE